jgi:DDE domain
MSDFKGRHFEGEIVLWAVRWYCRYGISYRDLEQMMAERGVSVDHSTIYRWVQRYAPEIEKRLRWHWRRPRAGSWRVDETYVKVRGKWAYLYRAVDKLGIERRQGRVCLRPVCGRLSANSRRDGRGEFTVGGNHPRRDRDSAWREGRPFAAATGGIRDLHGSGDACDPIS